MTSPFDNLLMAYYIKESQNSFVSASADKEAEIVFSKQFVLSSDAKRESKCFAFVFSIVIERYTFGSFLVQRALYNSNL